MGYDADRHGDYEKIGDGPAMRLVQPTEDHHGHPIANRSGFAPCPRCETPTMLWWCADRTCDGARTSRAHEQECPRA